MDPAVPRRGLTPALWALIGCLGCLGLLGLVAAGGWGFWLLARGQYSEATPADRAVVLTAEDLAPFLEDFTPRPGVATVQRCTYLDGSMDVEYEYEDPRPEVPVYVTCTAGVERTEKDARDTYEMLGAGEKIGFALGGEGSVSEEEQSHLFRWGDESRLALLKADGNPVGHSFRARAGRKTFHLMFVGVWFDDREALEGLLGPVLERFEKY